MPTRESSANEFAWLAAVLPNAGELARVLGGQPMTDEIEPLVGGVTDLRDTMTGSQVTEIQCLGAVAPLERRTFEAVPVLAVAYATLPDATFGAVALSSIENARSLFSSFVNEWQQCTGKTIVKSDGIGTYQNEIGQVSTTENMVSAVVSFSMRPNSGVTQIVRALGVAEDCIVDVEIPVSDPSALVSGMDTPAAELVQLMLAKVAIAQPTAAQDSSIDP